VDPAVTKRVSYFKESVLILTLASEDVINESFLQEKKTMLIEMISIERNFIVVKLGLRV
jgi:hypothetical protein